MTEKSGLAIGCSYKQLYMSLRRDELQAFSCTIGRNGGFKPSRTLSTISAIKIVLKINFLISIYRSTMHTGSCYEK